MITAVQSRPLPPSAPSLTFGHKHPTPNKPASKEMDCPDGVCPIPQPKPAAKKTPHRHADGTLCTHDHSHDHHHHGHAPSHSPGHKHSHSHSHDHVHGPECNHPDHHHGPTKVSSKPSKHNDANPLWSSVSSFFRGLWNLITSPFKDLAYLFGLSKKKVAP